MTVAALCPSCKAPLSETSVLALAPICTRCGVVITSIGGTLGMTSAYGVGDPSITRRRVEADLAVFLECQMKYTGMLEACKQQLEWGLERYAQLPEPPKFLELKNVPSFWAGLVSGLGFALAWFVASFIGSMAIGLVLGIYEMFHPWGKLDPWVKIIPIILWVVIIGGTIFAALAGPVPHIMAKRANGKKPRENARRQKAYDDATSAALKAAEPIKAAEDHRLRVQIRELEGLSKTVGEKAADVRQILATL